MCRYGEITLSPDTAAPGHARAWLRERLDTWLLSRHVDDLQLVVSELVTNAVLHARSTVEISVSVGEGVIELSVSDTDGRAPEPRSAGEVWDEGGRGLTLVSALSDDWGVAHRSNGKQIWVRLPTPRDWEHQKACVCGQPKDDEGRRVASGHRVVDMLA